MSSSLSRKLTLPPKDRAHWCPPKALTGPLLYLAWGARQYGLSPIPISSHEGWTYVIVEAGTPVLVCEQQRKRLSPGTLLVIGPECAFGWEDEGRRSSRLFVSVWREPGQAALRDLPSDGLAAFALSPSQAADLEALQLLCVKEAHRQENVSASVFGALQILIETLIVRFKSETEDDPDGLMRRAVGWIESHLATHQPLARLSDYLGVSTATIQRIFRNRHGTSVMRMIADLRCREADRLLGQKGTSIKQVAYQLGYRHPHDFSRAYLKHTGRPPRPSG